MTRWRWQLRTFLLAVAVIPPIVGILATLAPDHFADGLHFPRYDSISSFAVTTVFLTVPLSYFLGAVPAAVGAALYCLALSRAPRIRESAVRRSVLAAVFGGVVGALWTRYLLGPGGIYYGLISGFAAAVFATRWPRSERREPALLP